MTKQGLKNCFLVNLKNYVRRIKYLGECNIMGLKPLIFIHIYPRLKSRGNFKIFFCTDSIYYDFRRYGLPPALAGR
jgi:hypothetical protein